MPILVATILIPTMTFYFYALVQFWREAKRRRGSEMKVIMLRDPQADEAASIPEHELEPTAAAVISILQSRRAATNSGTRAVVATPIGAHRVALQKVAKG